MTAVLLAVPVLAQDRVNPFTDVPEGDLNMTTGPTIGKRLPDFAALDQHGVRRSFDEIKGPNGALVFFFRSADW